MPRAWFFDGCDLTDGHVLPNMSSGEYDRYVPSLPGPATSTSWPIHRFPARATGPT